MDRPLVPIPIARGRSGAVVAPHHLATAAGLSILRDGGTAVDAAIATNAVLAVVAGNSCGIGGDAFWLIWDQAAGAQLALNGSGRAAAGADAAALRAAGHDRLPFLGPHTITVPGAVRSWADAHARFGRLPRQRLLADAIDLAERGFPAWDGFVGSVEASATAFGHAGIDAGGWHRVYRPHGRAWRPGELVRLPALARTLRRLADAGFADFYEGEIADRQARGLAAAGTWLVAADLAGHASTWTNPIATEYRGVRVTTHPPNSQGVVALEILNILGRFEAPKAGAFAGGHGPGADWLHLGIEASRLAFADRDAHVTDPGARTVPVEWLLSQARAEELSARIDRRYAAGPPPSAYPPGGGTVYLATVDAEGNAVSLIESNYAGFGSGVVDPETGIGYQNRGAYFSLDPEHPNVLAPGRRTLHTLMPGMLFRDGRPWIVAGSMGGDAQPQIHAQVVSALVDGGVDVATAVGAPRWFVEPAGPLAPPAVVRIEPRFRAGVVDELRRLGHQVEVVAPFDAWLGHCHAIELVGGGPASPDGSLAAATDPRSAGLPAVR